MHILEIQIKENFRTLIKGTIIKLKNITLLVGDQGSGKSTLLSLIQKNDVNAIVSEYVKTNSISTYYFDTETMNPKVIDKEANYSNPDGTSKGIGMGAAILTHFESHGETMRKFTVDRISDAANCVLLLDEPESALSLTNQYKLAKKIKKANKKDVQLIIATHCLPLIESVSEVFNMDTFKWESSKQFIKSSKEL